MIEPTIFYGNGSRAVGNNATPTTPCTVTTPNTLGDEACGDVLAHGFLNRGRGTVFDVCICDTDSHSYGNTSLSKILERHTKEKKDKYEVAFLDRAGISPLLSTLSMAWLPMTSEWPSDVSPSSLQRSGAAHTQTWLASLAQG